MPTLTLGGSPTFGGDSSCTIDGADRVQGPAALVDESQAWVAVRARMNVASTDALLVSTGITFFSWRDDSTHKFYCGAYETGSGVKFSMERYAGSGTQAQSAAQTWAVDDEFTLVYAWEAGTLKVSVNGGAFVSAADANVPTLASTLIDIGSNNGSEQANADILWLALGTGTLANADAATLHAFGDTDPDWSALPTPTMLWTAESSTYQDAAPTTQLRDTMQRNPGTLTGGVSISSMLVRDTNPAIRFSGGSSFTVPHSDALVLLNGAVGGVAFAFPLRLHSYPASEKYLFNKSGEYAASILSDGTLRFYLTSGHVDSSAPIPLDTNVFVSLVYNGAYSGVTKVGRTSAGSTTEGMGADYMAGTTTGENNVRANRHQMLERGQITELVAFLQRYDGVPSFQDVALVAFSDTSGPLPDAVLGQSAGQLLGSTALGTQPLEEVTFAVPEPFELDINDFVWLGYAGGARHTSESPVMLVSVNSSGGTRKGKNAVVSASSAGPASQSLSSFGAAALSDSVLMAVYANYTPLARTGDEGNLLVYLDGQEDARAAYTSGITAGTADLTGPEFDVDMDELLLWDRKLGPVEVAQFFAAR